LIVCDLAEYYNIYDYEKFSPLKLATYVLGLGGSSRIKRELAGIKYTEHEIIQARILDVLSLTMWMQTKDGEKNRNRPESIVKRMLGESENKKQEYAHDVFDSVEEFNKARQKALEK